MVAVGKGASAGVQIRSAEALERIKKVNTLVVDKTGTLTEGKPKVTAIAPAAGVSEADILHLAGSLERSSEYPLASAIVAAAKERGNAIDDASVFSSLTDRAVIGKVDGKSVALGNAKLIADQGIELGDLSVRADRLRQQSATALFVGIEGK